MIGNRCNESFFVHSWFDLVLLCAGCRSACRSGSAFVSLQEDNAVLHLSSEPADLSVSFSKLTDHDGRTELKDLLFKMADSIMQQDNTGI